MVQLATSDHNMENFNPNNPYAGDEKNPVQFYMGSRLDDAKTEAEGRPIYKDEEFIRIFNSKDNIIERPIRPTDLQRWPRQYQAWKLTGESTPGAAGTRLEHWPQMTRAQVDELKYFKIFTVEQLADIPDSVCGQIPSVVKLKGLAKTYVAVAQGSLNVQQFQSELEKRDNAIEELKAEVARLTKMVQGVKK